SYGVSRIVVLVLCATNLLIVIIRGQSATTRIRWRILIYNMRCVIVMAVVVAAELRIQIVEGRATASFICVTILRSIVNLTTAADLLSEIIYATFLVVVIVVASWRE